MEFCMTDFKCIMGMIGRWRKSSCSGRASEKQKGSLTEPGGCYAQAESLEFDPEDAEECDNLDDFLHGGAVASESLYWDLVSGKTTIEEQKDEAVTQS